MRSSSQPVEIQQPASCSRGEKYSYIDMAEGGCGDYSVDEPDPSLETVIKTEVHKLVEGGKKEVTIVVVGTSGAGKTSLIRNVLGMEEEATGLNPESDTTEVEVYHKEKHGVTLNIADTIGLSSDNLANKMQLKEMGISIKDKLKEKGISDKVDLLLFCIPVGPSNKFQLVTPQIMESLCMAYGRNIWRHCLVVCTFSNQAWDRVKRKPNAVDLYKQHIADYTTLFRQELIRLGHPPEVTVNTIFDCPDVQQRPKHMIVAVPAGDDITDPVLPGIPLDKEGWVGRVFVEMVHSAEDDSKRALLQFRYTKEYLKKVIRNPHEYIVTPLMEAIKATIAHTPNFRH